MSTGTTRGRRTRNSSASGRAPKRNAAASKAARSQSERKRGSSASVSTTRSRTAAVRPQDAVAPVQGRVPNGSDPRQVTEVVSPAARHDIAGVALAVAGVALFISVASPGHAVISAAVGRGMLLGLGIGAYVLPLMLIAWAVTFFLHTNPTSIRRTGVGLALVAIAVIGLVALWTPGADVAPSTALFSESALVSRGGYVGNGIAWALVTLFGRGVGSVILVGVTVAGLIIIGLSISDLVERLAERYRARHLNRLPARARRTIAAGSDDEWDDWDEDDTPIQFDSNGDIVPDGERDYDVTPGNTTLLDTPQARDARIRRHKAGADTTQVIEAVDTAGATAGGADGTSEPKGAAPVTATLGPKPRKKAMQTRKLSGSGAVTQLLGRIGKGRGASLRDSEAYGADDDLSPDVQDDDPRWVSPDEVEHRPTNTTSEDERPSRRQPGSTTAPTTRMAPAPGAAEVGEEVRASAETPKAHGAPNAKPAAGRPQPDSAPGPRQVASGEGEVPFDEDVEEGAARSDAAGSSATVPIPGKVQDSPASSSQIAPAGSGVHATDAPASEGADGEGEPPFVLPDPALLVTAAEADPETLASARTECEQLAAELQQTLLDFSLDAKVVGWVNGPTVTQFKVEMPTGVRVNRITNLSDDIALALAAESVRVFAPIPGTSLVGVEVPNRTRSMVHFGDVISEVGPDDGPLTMAVGKDVDGTAILSDLARMPHLLIAGTTGSGKSVAENSMIMSMLMRATPEEVRMILIDPKRVEMSVYDGIPHLYVPVVTEPGEAASALTWGTVEMERRFKLIQKAGTRNIQRYNRMVREGALDDPNAEPMPYLVIVIDELADLMMQARKEVETSICRIAQLGRAAGIHLIIATQRPSTDIVTGLIKANITNRMALKVASGVDSRVIIDQTGAESLLGYGDMLLDLTEWNKPRRIQGCYLTDQEIHAVCDHLRTQGTPDYHEDILKMGQGTGFGGGAADVGEDDPLIWDAADAVVSMGFGSTSGLQRRLKVGYARAGRIMDMLEAKGIVGPPDGTKPREVLVDALELESLKAFEQADRDGMTGGGA